MDLSSPTASAKLVDAVGTGAGAAEDAAALSFSCKLLAKNCFFIQTDRNALPLNLSLQTACTTLQQERI